jgi:hypothetical protein
LRGGRCRQGIAEAKAYAANTSLAAPAATAAATAATSALASSPSHVQNPVRLCTVYLMYLVKI